MANLTAVIDLSKYRIVKHVTRPLLKIEEGRAYYVKIDGAIFQAEQSKKPKMVEATVIENGVETKKQVPVPPPFVVNVTNLESGAPSQMVCNEVFRTELEKQYPKEVYVGKLFELTKNTKAEGKNYNTFGITELALAEEQKEEGKSTAADTKKK